MVINGNHMFIITVSSFVSNNFRGRMWCNLHEVAACSFGIKHSRYCTGPIIRWPPKFDEHPWFIIKDDQSWICKPHFHIIIHDNILSFWIGRSHICSTSTKPPRCGLYQMQTVANWLKEDAEHAALRVCVCGWVCHRRKLTKFCTSWTCDIFDSTCSTDNIFDTHGPAVAFCGEAVKAIGPGNIWDLGIEDNPPFSVDDFPTKTSIFVGAFPAMLAYQRVYRPQDGKGHDQ